jgi:hypothetical protein
VGLINVLIRGETNVGSIVGQSNFGCFVTNSFSKGDVNGFNNVGGLMGSSYNGGSIIHPSLANPVMQGTKFPSLSSLSTVSPTHSLFLKGTL